MCMYVFLAVLRAVDSIGCCQNRCKISGDRNARPSPKGIPQLGRQVGWGLPRILKILLPLEMRKAFGKAKSLYISGVNTYLTKNDNGLLPCTPP